MLHRILQCLLCINIPERKTCCRPCSERWLVTEFRAGWFLVPINQVPATCKKYAVINLNCYLFSTFNVSFPASEECLNKKSRMSLFPVSAPVISYGKFTELFLTHRYTVVQHFLCLCVLKKKSECKNMWGKLEVSIWKPKYWRFLRSWQKIGAYTDTDSSSQEIKLTKIVMKNQWWLFWDD